MQIYVRINGKFQNFIYLLTNTKNTPIRNSSAWGVFFMLRLRSILGDVILLLRNRHQLHRLVCYRSGLVARQNLVAQPAVRLVHFVRCTFPD